MAKKICIQELKWFHRCADALMIPLMHILSGSMEEPQQTHFWNNSKLTVGETEHIDRGAMVHCHGIPGASNRKILGIPIFHIPILGGWRNYVVLKPCDAVCIRGWYVGWMANDVIGVSRIPLVGSVRLLLGPGDVAFFGISFNGDQIPIKKIGEGRIGDGGSYCKVPLL